MILVSIIIPIYKDWDRLFVCLEALSRQTFSKEAFEVIVVNNEPTESVFDSSPFQSKLNLVFLHEDFPGSYAARNKGLKIAKGDIVGFTDSDCIPHDKWIENAVAYFNDDSNDRVAGKVKLFFENSKRKSAAELYESAFSFNQRRNVNKYGASITANFFTRRQFFDDVGFFDNRRKSGEDFGWNRRANNEGLSLIYADDVVVEHPARANLAGLADKKRRVLGGKKTFNFRSPKGVLKELFYIPFIFFKTFILPAAAVLFKKNEFTFIEKTKIVYVLFFLQIVVNIEYFRLLFGGVPRR